MTDMFHIGDDDAAAIEDLGERLGREYNTLSELKKHIISVMDPNRTGMIGVGEWMCIWMKGRAIERKRNTEGMRELMGGKRKDHKQTAMAVAVASYIASRTVKKEYELELVDDRSFTEKQLSNLWYGDAAVWRTQQRHQHSDLPTTTSLGYELLFTHKMLVDVRSVFQDYEDGDSIDTIRFGAVAAFLNEIRHNPSLGPVLSLTSTEIHLMLDDLVSMTRRSLEPEPSSSSWVEPSFPFVTIFSLLIKHVTAVDQQEAVVSFIKKGLLLFNELSVQTPNAAPIRTLITLLASRSPQSFRDSNLISLATPKRHVW